MTAWGGRKVAPLVLAACEQEGWVCWLCGDPITMAERSADHDPPRSTLVRNGVPDPDDLRWLRGGHLLCNQRRGIRRVTDELRAELVAKRAGDRAKAQQAARLSSSVARRRPTLLRAGTRPE